MNALDRLISYLSPAAGLRRMAARASLQQIAQLTGTPRGPYAAANVNRLNPLAQAVTKENQVSGSRVDSLRSQSWDLFRDNPSARKIVRTIVASRQAWHDARIAGHEQRRYAECGVSRKGSGIVAANPERF